MNIDELVNSIPEDRLRLNLFHWVSEWKKDDTDIHRLYEIVAKWHGNVWFQDQKSQNEFWSSLQAFKINAIDGLGGMTVNERLYWFGLFDEWNNADKKGQQCIRGKLHALPKQ